MLKLAHILFLLGLLAAVGFAQVDPKTCTCKYTYTTKRQVRTATLTGTSSCSRYRVPATCPPGTTTLKSSTTSSKPITTSTPKVTSTPLPSSTPAPTPSSTPKPSSTPTPTPSSTPKPTSSSTPAPSPSSSSSTTSTKPSSTLATSTRVSSTSTSTSCVPTPTKNSGKRGAAYNSTPLTNLLSLSTCPSSGSTSSSKVSWAYNWYSSKATDSQPTSFNPALTFIPMLWSAHPDLTSVWNTNANAALAAGAKELLAFNEPDGCGNGGSCMNLSATVQGYKDWLQPFKSKARLGAPAVTNGGSPMGLTFLQNFLSQCSGCQVDFVPIHWYGDASQVQDFKNYVAQAYAAAGNRPLWITEFGCTSGSDDAVKSFMKQTFAWMDGTSYVERYAWFMLGEGWTVTNGVLNDKGVIMDRA